MIKQQTLAMAEDHGTAFARYAKPTRRDGFLKAMNALMPWSALCDEIAPYYPKGANGRPPVGLERMLRMYCLQHWFNLADQACEEALYDSANLGRFVGIDLGREPVPDATTLLRFRRRLEANKLGEALFARMNEELKRRGYQVRTGTIVDATIMGAPSSTKNREQARDPEMHQTKKGQQWYFGMKLHIGVDSVTGLVHSARVTAANEHDKHSIPNLLHGEERRVYGDCAYHSQKDLIASKAPHAKDFTNERTRWKGWVDEEAKRKNRTKSRVRAKVEHMFAVVKRQWGFAKVRYRGLAKNTTRAFVALALANVYMTRPRCAG